MKKLLTLSLLILGFLTSFANNGENEMTLKLNSISIEKPMVNNSEDLYKFRIYVQCIDENGELINEYVAYDLTHCISYSILDYMVEELKIQYIPTCWGAARIEVVAYNMESCY